MNIFSHFYNFVLYLIFLWKHNIDGLNLINTWLSKCNNNINFIFNIPNISSYTFVLMDLWFAFKKLKILEEYNIIYYNFDCLK